MTPHQVILVELPPYEFILLPYWCNWWYGN